MKKLFFILFLMAAMATSAQSKYKPVKSVEPFTSKSGHVFKVGDTIHLSKASMPDRSFKCGILVPKKSYGVLAGSPGLVLNTHYERTDWIIDHFLVYTNNGKSTTYAYFKIDNEVYHGELMIDCAIEEGELVIDRK